MIRRERRLHIDHQPKDPKEVGAGEEEAVVIRGLHLDHIPDHGVGQEVGRRRHRGPYDDCIDCIFGILLF